MIFRERSMRTIALLLCLNSPFLYAAEGAAPENPGYTADFRYVPAGPGKKEAPEGKPAAAAVKTVPKMNFTIGDLSYKANRPALKDARPWFMYPQFAGLKDAIRRDLTAILEAKGLGVLGPFESYDMIPYQDKKNLDIYMSPAAELRISVPGEIRSYGDIKVWVEGNIAIELRESSTRELMWVRRVVLSRFEVPHTLLSVAWKENLPKKIRLDNTTKKAVDWVYLDLEQLFNGIAKGVEAQYPALMAEMDAQIVPAGMAELKRQCAEIRAKKN